VGAKPSCSTGVFNGYAFDVLSRSHGENVAACGAVTATAAAAAAAYQGLPPVVLVPWLPTGVHLGGSHGVVLLFNELTSSSFAFRRQHCVVNLFTILKCMHVCSLLTRCDQGLFSWL
jgi:hypothetical protein